jgi:hypothetical protein
MPSILVIAGRWTGCGHQTDVQEPSGWPGRPWCRALRDSSCSDDKAVQLLPVPSGEIQRWVTRLGLPQEVDTLSRKGRVAKTMSSWALRYRVKAKGRI